MSTTWVKMEECECGLVSVVTVPPAPRVVVTQDYKTRVNDEDVLKGNSVILKCVIPSFVADFVSVQAWVDGQGKTYYPPRTYGNASPPPPPTPSPRPLFTDSRAQ